MIQTQSFYISGIEDPDQAKTNAYGAMGMFLFTFIASLVGIWYDSHFGKGADLVADGGEEGEYRLASDKMATYGSLS